jgi:voltage-gated potassium channel
MPHRSSAIERLGMTSWPGQAPTEGAVFLRRLALLGVLIVVLLAGGTIGLALAEGTSVGFAFVWALDTVATVGSIPGPESVGGHVVKMLLIVFGVGTLFYALVTMTEFFVAGRHAGLLAERRLQRMMNSFSDHHLICGFGRVGRQVARDLRVAGQQFVIVDDNPVNREIAEEHGAVYLEGRPSEDEILRRAGIDRARSVIACMDSDAENIFATLTARELRPDVTIVARASVEDSEKKLRRAGADRVISPYKASGAEMARLALHPQVAGVVDVAPEYRMEEIEVAADCPGAGKRISEVRGTAAIVALRRTDGKIEPQPAGNRELCAGDVLVAMGTREAMDRLERIFESRSASAAPGGLT